METVQETSGMELREFIRQCCDSLEDGFRLLDVRCAGSLTQEDFMQGLAVLGYTGNALDVFFEMDIDSDGKVSAKEFNEYFSAMGTQRSMSCDDCGASVASATSADARSGGTGSATQTSEANRLSVEFNVLKLALRRMHAERHEQHASMLKAIRSGMHDTIKEEVQRAVSDAVEKQQRKTVDELFGDGTHAGGTATVLKENLECIKEQMLDFASAVSAISEEIAGMKERIDSVDEQCQALSRDHKSTRILARRAVDLISVGNVDGEAAAEGKAAATTEDADGMIWLKGVLDQMTSRMAELHDHMNDQKNQLNDQKNQLRLVFDNSASLASRLDGLQACIINPSPSAPRSGTATPPDLAASGSPPPNMTQREAVATGSSTGTPSASVPNTPQQSYTSPGPPRVQAHLAVRPGIRRNTEPPTRRSPGSHGVTRMPSVQRQSSTAETPSFPLSSGEAVTPNMGRGDSRARSWAQVPQLSPRPNARPSSAERQSLQSEKLEQPGTPITSNPLLGRMLSQPNTAATPRAEIVTTSIPIPPARTNDAAAVHYSRTVSPPQLHRSVVAPMPLVSSGSMSIPQFPFFAGSSAYKGSPAMPQPVRK